jgi:hypothetical protein
MLIGYARVSTHEQTLYLQQDALQKAGCNKFFTNQSQKSLPENSWKDNHETGDGEKSEVVFGVPVVPGDQPPPVV